MNNKIMNNKPVYYVVFTDTFMSGWGKAKYGKSYVAYPITEEDLKRFPNVIERLLNFLRSRTDTSRVRVNLHKPRTGPNDHLVLHDIPWHRILSPKEFDRLFNIAI